jgi:hypothetical protein
MWIRLDSRRSANGERERAPLPLNAPSAPIWVIEDRLAISAASGICTRDSACRVEPVGRERQLSVLMQAAEYTPVGPSKQYRPAHWRLTKTPRTIGGFEQPLGFAGEMFRPASRATNPY